MANNIFNTNLELSSISDENIASTTMGVAVKNGDSWRIYDKDKKKITEVGDMQIGKSHNCVLLPTTKLKEGNLIKDGSEYCFVKQIATHDSPMQTISVKTDEIKNVTPIKNFLGFECYLRVIVLDDDLNMVDEIDVKNWLFCRQCLDSLTETVSR